MDNEQKLWLAEGFCPVDGFYCLMPVAYKAEVEDGSIKEYVKQSMACRHASAGECEQAGECVFYAKAPERLGKNADWYEG